MELFKLEGHFFVIDNEVVRIIPEFENLIKRDKDKQTYIKEFKYIYLSHSYRSPFVDLPDRERNVRVMKTCGLPNTWKVDKDIEAAVNAFNELQNLPASFSIINNLNKSVNLSGRIIGALNSKMEQLIENSNNTNPDNISTDILAIKPMMEEILDSANKLPKILSNIELATDKFKKDMSIEAEKRGGGKRGNRENKDYQENLKRENE